MSIEHWMMFGTFAEQRHFVYPDKNTYYGVIINGNMVAHAPTGMAAFLLEKTGGARYIIDPLTHAFQHDPCFIIDSEKKPKSSIQSLADHYGSPVNQFIGKRPLVPSDFNSRPLVEEFTRRCLDFQIATLLNQMKSNDAIKYLDPDDARLKPYALIPPYLYMSEVTYQNWLPINLAMIDAARNQASGSEKLFGSIVVSQGAILDKTISDTITAEYSSKNLDGYLVWIDNLNEQEAGSYELRCMLNFVRKLRCGGTREVINLHGGYFSIMASGVVGNKAMSGVTHGPEFGEFRSVVPVGGGIPIARYYLPDLHSRIRYRDAIRYFQTKGWLADASVFHKEVCNCAECAQTINGDPGNFIKFGTGNAKEVKRGRGIVRIEYPTMDTKLHCLRHYLQRKNLEYQFAASASKEQIIEDLSSGIAKYEDIVGPDGTKHLSIWKSIFENGDVSRSRSA